MKVAVRNLFLLILCLGTMPAYASSFQHIVVIFQENRTPDNLFQGLCSPPFGSSTSCSITPSAKQYDIQTSNWLDKSSHTGKTQPQTIPLANKYDLGHSHPSFNTMCDLNTVTGVCRMDGAGGVGCIGTCPTKPQFRYVDNAKGILNPYLTLATQYGWANYMFQTNQGPSFPAHQIIFGGTSAPSAADDHAGTFAAENMSGSGRDAGCIADASVLVQLIDANGVEDFRNRVYPCFEHNTLADLFKSFQVSWRYYTAGVGSIWTGPNAIHHICQPSGKTCTGPDWMNNVDLSPRDALTDIGNCKLREVSWIIPDGGSSDHAKTNSGGGPSWVASIVNAIGNSTCKNPDGTSYWSTTAILITWDDWGGWYDHEPPTILPSPQGGYQYGFRVPLIVVSAFTPLGYINNQRHDFGSMLRFIEHNFGIQEGALNFADARAQTDLLEFFKFNQPPRKFQTIPAALDAYYFLNDRSLPTDPDDD
jgi:phospholipase C